MTLRDSGKKYNDLDLLDQIKVYKTVLINETPATVGGRIYCKVSGVSFDGRQEVVRHIEQETPIRLVRDRRNEHDFYAISVQAYVNGVWKDAGFVPSKINKEIALYMDSGKDLSASVWRKVGGDGEYYHGFTIVVSKVE